MCVCVCVCVCERVRRLCGSAPNPNPKNVAYAANVIKSYFNAEVCLKCMPRSLQACAEKHGWMTVDRVWVTLLAVKSYEDLGHKWVINPWDEDYDEYDVKMKAWNFLDMVGGWKGGGGASRTAAWILYIYIDIYIYICFQTL